PRMFSRARLDRAGGSALVAADRIHLLLGAHRRLCGAAVRLRALRRRSGRHAMAGHVRGARSPAEMVARLVHARGPRRSAVLRNARPAAVEVALVAAIAAAVAIVSAVPTVPVAVAEAQVESDRRRAVIV